MQTPAIAAERQSSGYSKSKRAPAKIATSLDLFDDPGAVLAPLPGEVCEQYVRCGKANCRCSNGQLHGPYHYRVWREGTRVYKQYVKPAEVESTRERCRIYRSLYAKRARKIRPTEALAV